MRPRLGLHRNKRNNLTFTMLTVHVLNVHNVNLVRGKLADATNNGTKCASARMIPLTEENTCNDVSCPPFAGGKNNLKSSNAISQLLCSILYSVPVATATTSKSKCLSTNYVTFHDILHLMTFDFHSFQPQSQQEVQ